MRAPINLPDHTDLASAVLLVAMMGGYRNRTHDPPPGHQIFCNSRLLKWSGVLPVYLSHVYAPR